MAREAYRSLYGDLTKLKDPSLLDGPAGGVETDDALFHLLLAVSASVDDHCSRHFFPLPATRFFDGPLDGPLPLPDLISLSSVHTDEDGDGVHERVWAPEDFWLGPPNAEPYAPWGRPYSWLRVRRRNSVPQLGGVPGCVALSGVWGYRMLVEPSGSALGAGLSDIGTALSVDSGADFAVGQTVMVDDEQMLVTDISGSTLTVRRGLNGTAAVVHANGSSVGILRWPAPVERATLINAARIWTRAPAFEPFYVDAGLDTDVRMLLEPYRRIAP